MIRPDYYSGGSGTFQIGAFRIRKPDPNEKRFRLDLSLIAYKNGEVDGVTYPSFWFTYEEFPPDKLTAFCFGKGRSLTVLDYYDCRPEEKEKFFGTNVGGKKDFYPAETLKNLLCADGEVKAVLDGPFRYQGKHALGEDEETALSEEGVRKASEVWMKFV